MLNKQLTAQFNRFEITLPEQAVKDCSHSGACDDDVEYWESRIGILITVDPELIRSELKDYGAWDDKELSDDKANRQRIIWLAAGQIQDEEFATK